MIQIDYNPDRDQQIFDVPTLSMTKIMLSINSSPADDKALTSALTSLLQRCPMLQELTLLFCWRQVLVDLDSVFKTVELPKLASAILASVRLGDRALVKLLKAPMLRRVRLLSGRYDLTGIAVAGLSRKRHFINGKAHEALYVEKTAPRLQESQQPSSTPPAPEEYGSDQAWRWVEMLICTDARSVGVPRVMLPASTLEKWNIDA